MERSHIYDQSVLVIFLKSPNENLSLYSPIHMYGYDHFSQGEYIGAYASRVALVKSIGKSFQTDIFYIWMVRNGKIAQFQGFYDSAALAGAQLA